MYPLKQSTSPSISNLTQFHTLDDTHIEVQRTNTTSFPPYFNVSTSSDDRTIVNFPFSINLLDYRSADVTFPNRHVHHPIPTIVQVPATTDTSGTLSAPPNPGPISQHSHSLSNGPTFDTFQLVHPFPITLLLFPMILMFLP